MLEDTKEYISYAPKDEIKAQDRRPFDLLVRVWFGLVGQNQYLYSNNHIGVVSNVCGRLL